MTFTKLIDYKGRSVQPGAMAFEGGVLSKPLFEAVSANGMAAKIAQKLVDIALPGLGPRINAERRGFDRRGRGGTQRGAEMATDEHG